MLPTSVTTNIETPHAMVQNATEESYMADSESTRGCFGQFKKSWKAISMVFRSPYFVGVLVETPSRLCRTPEKKLPSSPNSSS